MSNVSLWPAEWDRPFTVGEYDVDPVARTISHAGETRNVQPRVMALLIALARRPGEVQRRETLIEAIWPKSPGGDQSLSNAMSLLRRALGEGAGDEQLIETVPKIGYRLTVAPNVGHATPSTASEGVVARRRALGPVAAMLAAVVAFVAGAFAVSLRDAPTPEAAGEIPRVAVFPVAADAALAPTALALTNELRAMLSGVTGVRVLDAATSYRVASGEDLADLVVEAGIAGEGDALRGVLKISEAAAGAPVYERTLRPEAPGSLALREALLRAMAEGLSEVVPTASLSRGDTAARFLVAPTDSLEAYRLFSLGIYEYTHYTPERMAIGIESVRAATRIDPGFVDAWVQLGDMYAYAGSHQGFLSPEEAHPQTRDALLRAVTLDPEHAMAQASLGDHYACVQADLELAGKAFERALAADPGIRHHGITRYLALTGRRDEALEYIEETLAVYPDSPWEMQAASGHYSSFRATERALELSRRILEIWPGDTRATVTRASSLAQLGRVDEALALLRPLAEAEGAAPRTRLIYAMMLARSGNTGGAREILDAVRASSDRVAESHLAMTYGWIGDHDEAIRWLRLADEKGEFGLCYLPFEPAWDPLRKDPRFNEIVAARYPAFAN